MNCICMKWKNKKVIFQLQKKKDKWYDEAEKWRYDRLVTVHSVPSNTLRDAQNLCYSHKFARYVSGFWHSHAKTPRGIVACER